MNTKQILVLPHIKVNNANAWSSPYTSGFPSVCAFGGAVHALQRKFVENGFDNLEISGFSVISHKFSMRTYKESAYSDLSIIASANPLDKNGERPSFVPEIKCRMEISLLCELKYNIDDNEALHCQNITVEMMIKASPEAAAQYAAGDWLHALSMVSDVANNKRAWGIMIRGAGEMFCYMENYKDSTKSINGYNGSPYFYSSWVSGSIPKITDGKWHHVAMTYDGETVRLYVDYTERGSCAYAGPIAYNDDCNGKLSIGPNYANSYGGWDGFIDEVRISDVALPPEKFLRVGGLANNASDQDTAIYLPFNSFETSNDAHGRHSSTS